MAITGVLTIIAWQAVVLRRVLVTLDWCFDLIGVLQNNVATGKDDSLSKSFVNLSHISVLSTVVVSKAMVFR